ncbi:hypothetical protein [Desulfatitalea tepidiphila]|uniref:hypothetical protein n=1 Tax=Desulfatitalea tepidiphila TaxID=1185843 RepID=UPI00128FADAC|nr:hypothetical protein [Desulfatitalea tepidiphila]
MDADPTYGIPISDIKRDKNKILSFHASREPARQLMKSKERIDALNMITNLIDKWKVQPNEIYKCIPIDESWSIEMEQPYGPDISEAALEYSILIHDIFGFDYKCKGCVVRATCCRFSNFDRFENSGECDGISQLLNAAIIKDIEDYYLT